MESDGLTSRPENPCSFRGYAMSISVTSTLWLGKWMDVANYKLKAEKSVDTQEFDVRTSCSVADFASLCIPVQCCCIQHHHPSNRHIPTGRWVFPRCSTPTRWYPLAKLVFVSPITMVCGRYIWLVVWTPLKNISQLGWLFPIYEKMFQTTNQILTNTYYGFYKPTNITGGAPPDLWLSGTSSGLDETWMVPLEGNLHEMMISYMVPLNYPFMISIQHHSTIIQPYKTL